MEIDYKKYSYDELLEAYDYIDKDVYPNRYRVLVEEIKRRKNSGDHHQEIDDEEESSQVEFSDILIEFSADKGNHARWYFVAFFILLHAVWLAIVTPNYLVSDINDLHQYTTEVEQAQCKRSEVYNEDTDTSYEVFDVYIDVYQQQFFAPEIDKRRCQRIANTLKPGAVVSIWQEDGLIHQLDANGKHLLSNKYMEPKIRAYRSGDLMMHLVLLFFLWALLGRSLINAVFPQTFTKS